MMKDSFLSALDELIAKRTLLKHPFYESWSAGKLSLHALAGYVKEYFHVVTAVPEMVEQLSEQAPDRHRADLEKNGQEEREHIDLWLAFSRALGISDEAMKAHCPCEKTKEAVKDLLSLTSTFSGGAAALYAFEKEIPMVSLTKKEGLRDFYGIEAPEAVEYFVTHAEADVRHAAAWRAVLSEGEGSEEAIIRAVTRSLDAQHKVLDACYETYC